MSNKYSQKLLDHGTKPSKGSLKTSPKRFIQKATEETGNLIGNKIANKITKASKNSKQNKFETVTNEYDKEIPKEK